jgi:Protein of unknown function (DUF2934)
MPATVTAGSAQQSEAKRQVSADYQSPETGLEKDIAKLAYALWQQRGSASLATALCPTRC